VPQEQPDHKEPRVQLELALQVLQVLQGHKDLKDRLDRLGEEVVAVE
jgi:hypothetical protein